jgi:hypothetical protein
LLIFKGIAVSFILPRAALILQIHPSFQILHLRILLGACKPIAFVQIIFDMWLKRMIFSGKEKGERKKRNEYKVALQQIQVQQYGIIYSHCISHFMLIPFLYMQYLIFSPY